ncbi:MAG: MerR family transcriptional regulator [Firmicutes bacterium]|nr:MerR family transcriptional regulator [Bacillota bacterium]
MSLTKITDLVTRFDISSRSLRYYEQVGLIQSVRIPFDKYRYYDNASIERLKQIMVLREMLIPIKDIIRIYESETMDTVVQTFVNRIQSIDDEVNALGSFAK